MPIIITEVKSGNIKGVGYNPVAKKLVVIFKNGVDWEYENVPENVHAAFMKAQSKGQFFANFIRSKYKARQRQTFGLNKEEIFK